MEPLFLDFTAGAGLELAQALGQASSDSPASPYPQENGVRKAQSLHYQLADLSDAALAQLGYEKQPAGWWYRPQTKTALVVASAGTQTLQEAIAQHPQRLVIAASECDPMTLSADAFRLEQQLVTAALLSAKADGTQLLFVFATATALLGPAGILTRQRPDLALALGGEIAPLFGVREGSGSIWATAAYACDIEFVPAADFLVTELGLTAAGYEDSLLQGGDAPIFVYQEFDAANPVAMDACALIALAGFRVVAIVQPGAGISRRDAAGWGLAGLVLPGENGWPLAAAEIGSRLARSWL